MKFISTFFSSSCSQQSSGKSKKKPSKGRRSPSRFSETPSFGSSSSSGSSDFFPKAAAAAAPQTPRSVLLCRNASCLDPEYWPSPTADFAPKGAAGAAPAVAELFGVFDRDGDGKITREELEAVLRRLGDPPTEEEVAMMVAEVDRDGDGCISLDDFGSLGPALGGGGGAGDGDGDGEGDEEMRDAFGVFDADGDGRISAEELLGVFVALGDEGCTLEDCRRMIGGVDSHGDGFVRFEDFVHMMDAGRRKPRSRRSPEVGSDDWI